MSAYFELDAPETMRADAAVAGDRLPMAAPRRVYTDAFAGFPTDAPKPQVEISEAAERLASAIYG